MFWRRDKVPQLSTSSTTFDEHGSYAIVLSSSGDGLSCQCAALDYHSLRLLFFVAACHRFIGPAKQQVLVVSKVNCRFITLPSSISDFQATPPAFM